VCQIASAVFAAFLLVACAGGRETTRKDAVASYKLGIAYLTEGRIAPALQELSKAEALNPANPEVLNALGFAYWMRKEHFLAEEKFRKAVALKPDYSEAWNNLAAMFIEQGRYGEAVGPAEQALKNVYYGTQERALANLGWALHKSGRGEEGEKRLRQAIEVAPSFPLARRNLALLLAERGDHRRAVEQFDAALRLAGDDADLHLKRGVSLWKLGERQLARAAFAKAVQLAPESEVGRSAKTYLDVLD
jgi:Tfp pilus assembly protein PilF